MGVVTCPIGGGEDSGEGEQDASLEDGDGVFFLTFFFLEIIIQTCILMY